MDNSSFFSQNGNSINTNFLGSLNRNSGMIRSSSVNFFSNCSITLSTNRTGKPAVCSCGKNYIGETGRNVITRWQEHENIKLNSEPAKHLRKFPNHKFTWKIISNAPEKTNLRKNIEASIIAIRKPSLNDQLDSNRLILFRNGVT